MAISVRVVGIFFEAHLPNVKGPISVLNALKETKRAVQAGPVQKKDGTILNVVDFEFETSNPPKQSLVSFYAEYNGPVISPNIGRKLEYPQGQYFLPENIYSRPAYQVWQYYIYDENDVWLRTGIQYLEAGVEVPEGGTLIWRLVSVLATNNDRSPLDKARQQG